MLSILMPVYNERERVERAIREVLGTKLPTEFELIVVDAGSTDGTREILSDGEWDERARIVVHEHNRGKGAAVQTALAHAHGELACIFGADLEYDSARLLPPLLDGPQRLLRHARVRRVYEPLVPVRPWQQGRDARLQRAVHAYLRDIMTCHKMIRTELFRSLDLHAAGFTIEPETAARLIQHHERIFEVPVHYRARASAEGNKLTAAGGFRVLGTLLRCRLLDRG